MNIQDDNPTRFPFKMMVDVRFRDIDGMGHVNHAVYLTYFETARINYYMSLTGCGQIGQITMILAEVTASYHVPAVFGDQLEVCARVSRIGTKSFDMEYLIVRSSDRQRIASGRSVQVMYDYAGKRSIPVSDQFRAQVAAQDRDQS